MMEKKLEECGSVLPFDGRPETPLEIQPFGFGNFEEPLLKEGANCHNAGPLAVSVVRVYGFPITLWSLPNRRRSWLKQ
jgi:hypothetical protein